MFQSQPPISQNLFLTKEFVQETFPKEAYPRLNAVTAMLESWSELIWPLIRDSSPTPQLNSLREQLNRARMKIQQADKLRPRDHFEGRGPIGVEVSKHLRMITMAQPHSIQNERLAEEYCQLFVFPIDQHGEEDLDKIGQDLLRLCQKVHEVAIDHDLKEEQCKFGVLKKDHIFKSDTPLLYIRGAARQHAPDGRQSNVEAATYQLYSSKEGHFKIFIDHPIEGKIEVNSSFFLDGMLLGIVYGLWLMYVDFKRITEDESFLLSDYQSFEDQWKNDFLDGIQSKFVVDCLIDDAETAQ